MIGVGSLVHGKYRITRLLGDGGMGSVYEASHAVLGTRVAIKLLHPELMRRTGLVERFLQEARVAAQIRSPHVVAVMDVDRTPEGNAYIVMELLEGEPLSAVLDRQRKLPVRIACEYARQILEALEAAHALGVIHRDLKPENVLITFAAGKPVLKLIDFGIAKARRTDPQQRNLTVAGVVMGTAEYMAPEQARSADKVDARSDLYAVGVMLFEMIAGSRPVSGEDARVIAFKVERGEIAALVKVAPDVPREIAGLVHRAMAARPEMRFATAAEMRVALEKASGANEGVGAAPVARPPTQPTAVFAAPARTPVTPPGSGEREPPVDTQRAAPLATAMAPAAFAAMPAPAASNANRRGPRASLVALVALALLLGAGVVAVVVANGAGASDHDPRTEPSSQGEPPPPSQGATSTPSPTAPSETVPPLAPTVATATHPLASSHPSSRPSGDGDAGWPPLVYPSVLPSSLPPFPTVLPPFPTMLPSIFPSVLPPWPPPPAPARSPGENASPGY